MCLIKYMFRLLNSYKVVFVATFLIIVPAKIALANTTYYFANNPSIQGPRNQFSLNGWSITTDGTKGFLSDVNILDISTNVSGSVMDATTISLNNIFATDSHLGFVNPLVARFSNYWGNDGYVGSWAYGDWSTSKMSNQNFSIDVNQGFKINYALQLSSLTGQTTPYGNYPDGVTLNPNAARFGYPSIPTMDIWYCMEYSADNRFNNNIFSNYGATDASGDYTIGLGITGFSISGTIDEEHMRDEMISDGFSDLALPNQRERERLTAPMVIASSVPEPSSLSLLALGGLALAFKKRRQA